MSHMEEKIKLSTQNSSITIPVRIGSGISSSASTTSQSTHACCSSCYHYGKQKNGVKIVFRFKRDAILSDATITSSESGMNVVNSQDDKAVLCKALVVNFLDDCGCRTTPTVVDNCSAHQELDSSVIPQTLFRPQMDDIGRYHAERNQMVYRAYFPLPSQVSHIEQKYEEPKFPELWRRLKSLEKEVQHKPPFQGRVAPLKQYKISMDSPIILGKVQSIGVGGDARPNLPSNDTTQNYNSDRYHQSNSSATIPVYNSDTNTADFSDMRISVSTQTDARSSPSEIDSSDQASTKSLSAVDASTDTTDLAVIPSEGSIVFPKWANKAPNYRNLVIRTRFRCPSVPSEVRHLLNAHPSAESISSSVTIHSDISQSTCASHSEDNIVGCESIPALYNNEPAQNANYIGQHKGCLQQTAENLLLMTSSRPDSSHIQQQFQRQEAIIKHYPAADDHCQSVPSVPEAISHPENEEPLRSQRYVDSQSPSFHNMNAEVFPPLRSRPIIFYCSPTQRQQIRLRESQRNPLLIKLCRSCYCVLQDVTQSHPERSIVQSETHLGELPGTRQVHTRSERPHTADVILPTRDSYHSSEPVSFQQSPVVVNAQIPSQSLTNSSPRKVHAEAFGDGEGFIRDNGGNNPAFFSDLIQEQGKTANLDHLVSNNDGQQQDCREISIKVMPTTEFEDSLPPEFMRSCELINDYLLDLGKNRDSSLKRPVVKVQQKWFEVAGSKVSNSRLVKIYIAFFRSLSSQMLKWIVNRCDTEGNTVLNFALANNRFDVVRDLLQTGYCDLNKPNKVGNTPMIICASCKPELETDIHTIRNMFRVGNVNFRSRQRGQTALMTAVNHGNLKVCELLLNAGADINAQDDDGSTALMFAAEKGQVECTKLLLAQAECSYSMRDNNHSDACTIALDAGHSDVALLIYVHMTVNKSPVKSKRKKPTKS